MCHWRFPSTISIYLVRQLIIIWNSVQYSPLISQLKCLYERKIFSFHHEISSSSGRQYDSLLFSLLLFLQQIIFTRLLILFNFILTVFKEKAHVCFLFYWVAWVEFVRDICQISWRRKLENIRIWKQLLVLILNIFEIFQLS